MKHPLHNCELSDVTVKNESTGVPRDQWYFRDNIHIVCVYPEFSEVIKERGFWSFRSHLKNTSDGF